MSETYSWYATLMKPAWAPPAWLFGPVWSVLYVLIALSFGYVFYKTWRGELSKSVVLPFALNLVFNLAFSPIQFGLQNNYLAALDIALILATLIWAMKAILPRHKWVAAINIPYLLWVGFATLLQFVITYLNS